MNSQHPVISPVKAGTVCPGYLKPLRHLLAIVCLSAAFPQLDCNSHLAPPHDQQVRTRWSMRTAPGPSSECTACEEGQTPSWALDLSVNRRPAHSCAVRDGTLGQGWTVPRALSPAAGRVAARLHHGFSTSAAWPLSPLPGLDLVLHHHQPSSTPHAHAPRHVWDQFRHQPEHSTACTPDGVLLPFLFN